MVTGVEVVVEVDVTAERTDEREHAAAWADPPTVLNMTTIPKRTSKKLASRIAAKSTIFFIATHHCWTGEFVTKS